MRAREASLSRSDDAPMKLVFGRGVSNGVNEIEANQVYEQAYHFDRRYMVLWGGAGSGKSRFRAQKTIQKCLVSQRKVLAMRKVARTIKDSVFAEYEMLCKQYSVPYKANHTTYAIRFENNSEIIFMGMDDEEKLKSISGITDVDLEEATEFTKDEFEQIDIRLRGDDLPANAQISITFNGIHERHWINDYFFSHPSDFVRAQSFVQRTTYKDNEFLDAVYKERLESLTGNKRKVYTLGEWGSDDEGALWQNDVIERNRISAVNYAQDIKYVVIGVDPATSVSETSAETGIVVFWFRFRCLLSILRSQLF